MAPVVARYRRTADGVDGYGNTNWFRYPPSVPPDRLALVALSGLAEFREPFDALSAMRFHRFNPEAMRSIQDPDEGKVLRSDGSNIASVWGRLQERDPYAIKRITSYLNVIVPDIREINRVELANKETLQFRQAKHGTFPASSMSDGTLLALGALVASYQMRGAKNATTVVTIEEPESALHPAAVAAIMDALHEASGQTQIVVTSHSADVLDQVNLESDALLVTESRNGSTVVAEVDAASREAIRRHLYSPGELLRMDQLQPARAPEPTAK
jgi:predicted ATPase